MSEITCNAGGASTSWIRSTGRILYVNDAMEKSGLNFASKSFDAEGNVLAASVSIGDISVRNDKPNRNINDLRNTLNDFFQAINHDVALMDGEYTSNRKNIYRFIKFKFSSVNNPMVWKDLLTKFSGLEISMIKYNNNGNLWDYEGVIYAL